MVPLSSLSRQVGGQSRMLHRTFLCSVSSSINSSLAYSNAGSTTEHQQAFSFSSNSVVDAPIHVAFVGLGNMGLQMALNLAKKSKDSPSMQLTVHDLQESNISSFFEQAEQSKGIDLSNIVAASDLTNLGASNPDFVISSLPTCEASETVVGDLVHSLPVVVSGAQDGRSKGTTFIDTSTISPNVSKKLHQLVQSISPCHDYVDAPVSGGVAGAKAATLTFMVGCSSTDTLSTIQPLLQRMGKGIIPCGGSGSGSAVKLCNNQALAAQMLGICEAMNLGEALGVDPAILAGVMNVSTAKCWSSEVNNPHPDAAKHIGSGASANGYVGGFGTGLMLKDLNLAVDAGEEEGLALPVAGLSRDLYRMASLHGYGKKDFGVILEYLKGSSK